MTEGQEQEKALSLAASSAESCMISGEVDISFASREGELLLDSNATHGDVDKHCAKVRFNSMLALNAASILEKTDEQLLPSVYKYVGCSLRNSTPGWRAVGYDKFGTDNIHAASLAAITGSRAVFQALASSLGGYLGHLYNRALVTAAGCFIWGAMTLMFSFTNSLTWGAFAWAWNGVGLSFIIPNSQSLVADYYSDSDRGKAFGTLYTTGALGGMLGTMFATNIAGYNPFGIDGWRLAFRIVAFSAMMIGVAVLCIVKDPRHLSKSQTTNQEALINPAENPDSILQHRKEIKWKDAAADFFKVVRIPTFLVIILQGILGSTPWNALVFLTVYLQLIGFSDFSASLVNSLFLAGASLGFLVGGIIGDWAGKHDSDHGRIWVCQFSVFMGIPFTVALFKLMPYNGDTATVVMYSVLMFTFGLMHVWPAPACNNPVFAEIVPPHMRNLVYAFDRSFEGAIAAMGAPLVGIIAERVFHFPQESTITCDPVSHLPVSSRTLRDHDKAIALGNAMLVCMLVPWIICLIIYSFLHLTYPRDRKRAHRVE